MSQMQLLRSARRMRPSITGNFSRRAFAIASSSRRVTSAAPHLFRCTHPGCTSLVRDINQFQSIDSPFRLTRRFQSSQDVETSFEMLFDEASMQNLDTIYASPYQLLAQRVRTNFSYEVNTISINANGKDELWYTSTYNRSIKEQNVHFHSGKFGPLMTRLSEDELFYKTMVIDGKVYYTTEQHAKEAAAARYIDYIASRTKYRKKNYDLPVEPIRYCVEMPLLENVGADFLSASPQYDVVCRMQQKYGPVEVEYQIQTEQLEGSDGTLQDWYTATCVDPNSGEGFDSGVFMTNGGGMSFKYLPFKPSTPPVLEEIRVSHNRVYYKDEEFAKHAAAARALDCMNLRDGLEASVLPELNRMCFEEPYLKENGDYQPVGIDYNKIQRIVEDRRLDPEAELFYESLIGTVLTSPHFLHVPSRILQNTYRRHSLNEGLLDCAVTRRNFNGKSWHTASFAMPAICQSNTATTTEEFHSGLIGHKVNVKTHQGNTLQTPLHLANVKVADGRVYYETEQLASHAAAARAVDCILYRGNRHRAKHLGTAPPFQLCMEDPYMTANERDQQYIDYESLLDKRNAQRETATDIEEVRDINILPDSVDDALVHVFEVQPYRLHVPLSFLENVFRQYGFAHQAASSPTREETLIINGQSWYTCAIVDPVTNEEFYTGLVDQEVQAEKKQGNTLQISLHEAEVEVVNGRVYYRDPKLAKHAAAARAIDCYIFRRANRDTSNDALSMIQLCVEDPYLCPSDRDTQTIDYSQLLAQRTGGIVGDDVEFSSGNQYEIEQGDNLSAIFDTGHDGSAVGHETGRSSKLSTMGRIAEIWTNQHAFDSETPVEAMEEETPVARLDNIMAWYKRANQSPRSYDDAVALSDLCKRVLQVMAEASKKQTPGSGDLSIAEEARRIWNKLCTLQSEFGATLLDTNACNNYISCLESSDATLAQDLLSCMANETQFGELKLTLPYPNVDTYNAVMSLWSTSDGPDAKDGVNRVYTLLEDDATNQPNLHPNIDTFKILIAINSKRDDGTFSFQLAKSCLEKMQQMSQSFDALQPNLQIYNAALSKKRVINNDYKPSWLWKGRAYENGFADATASSRVEGSDVEEWCVLMEKNNVVGDIETFEAGIQAWVDTGTLDGLLRAEEWIKRVLILSANGSNPNITPRQETFQPIIAAWALCGNVRSRARVTEWINQLTALSTAMPHLPYLSSDVNTFAAKIIATRRYQASVVKQCLDNDIETSERDDIKLVFDLAKSCTNLLVKDLMSKTNFVGLIDADSCAPIFVNCIEAWGDASRLAMQNQTNELELNPMIGTREITTVSRLFESKLKKAIMVEEKCNKHYIECLGDIYSAVLHQLIELDSTSSKNTSEDDTHNSIVGERIADMERMLRNYEHYSRQLSGSTSVEMKVTRLGFYHDILRGCKGVTSSADYGHVVRICNVIMDFMAHSREFRKDECIAGGYDITNLFMEIVSIACKCVVHPRERKLVLTKIFDKASQFFDESDRIKFGFVDKSSLIGAIRVGLVDFDEDAESFVSSLEERQMKQRRWSKI